MSEVIVKGLPELRARFKAVDAEVGRKVLRTGGAAGSRVIRDAVKAAAPVRKQTRRYGRFQVPPGTLKAATLQKFIREQSNATQATYYVTFRQGKRFQKTGRDAYYAKWVERGHRIVGRRPKGTLRRIHRETAAASGRFVPGRYFMARAAAANASAAAQKAVDAMDRAIRKVPGIS